MLTKKLRDFETIDIVHREIYPQVPPKVEYSLTSLGKTLEPVIKALEQWGESYLNRE